VQDRRRMNGISNRIWHTDASFENPCGRYSMLYARNSPPVRAEKPGKKKVFRTSSLSD
jgi:alpha-ketoglutarate-dependent 2,4-dichlorophenoxyacetate dioxygenase